MQGRVVTLYGRLEVQQCVQRLLHATANHAVELALDYSISPR
jgi:hypothetical protein